MNSIVLDLEWNQAQTRDREAPGLTFEVIEIGASGNGVERILCSLRGATWI